MSWISNFFQFGLLNWELPKTKMDLGPEVLEKLAEKLELDNI